MSGVGSVLLHGSRRTAATSVPPHEYTLDKCGLTAAEIRRDVTEYQERYIRTE